MRAGERVVLWLPNTPRTPVYLFALWKLGAVVVPFDREMNPEAAAAIIDSRRRRASSSSATASGPAWAGGAPIVEWWEPGSADEGAQGSGGGGQWRLHPASPRLPRSPAPGRAAGGDLLHLRHDRHAEGLHDHPRQPLLAGRGAAGDDPAGHRLPAGEHPAALAPVRADRRAALPARRGAAIHYIPSRRGPDILRVLHEQQITHMIARAATADADGPGARRATPQAAAGAGLSRPAGAGRAPALAGAAPAVLARPPQARRPPCG